MTEHYYRWYSQYISREMEMLVFGDRGYPVILFPTSRGRHFENRDQGMMDAAHWFIEQGLVQIYCPDSMDAESWYNRSIHPADRVHTHVAYENMLIHDVVMRIRHNTGAGKVAVAGASFGGFHAVNFGFRHPGLVSHVFSMSGKFDIARDQLDGYWDDNAFYHNPFEYLPSNHDGNLWKQNIVLGTCEHDICRGNNHALSELLWSKNIPHWLDDRPGHTHDWPVWREMFPHYLSMIKFD